MRDSSEIAELLVSPSLMAHRIAVLRIELW